MRKLLQVVSLKLERELRLVLARICVCARAHNFAKANHWKSLYFYSFLFLSIAAFRSKAGQLLLSSFVFQCVLFCCCVLRSRRTVQKMVVEICTTVGKLAWWRKRYESSVWVARHKWYCIRYGCGFPFVCDEAAIHLCSSCRTSNERPTTNGKLTLVNSQCTLCVPLFKVSFS